MDQSGEGRLVARQVVELDDIIEVTERETPPPRATTDRPAPQRNLLVQDTVTMTVFAQDPSVGALLARIPVPADRLQRGPSSHRFRVVDRNLGTGVESDPAKLHGRDSWTYVDTWAGRTRGSATMVASARFRAQNVFAVASHTLALFERHLGRPVPWASGLPQLDLVPKARSRAEAGYSPQQNAVLFGWLSGVGGESTFYTALAFDIIAHEVSHAVLDGLRPRYRQRGGVDQLAFHEALADLVAMLAVFDLPDVAQRLLDPLETGRVDFGGATAVDARATYLRRTPLAALGEELGRRRGAPTEIGALRWSVDLDPDPHLLDAPGFEEPHRRAEVVVAAFMQTLVTIWANRLEALAAEDGGLDASRVAEEGTKAARHLLGMLLRSLDYLPPVELELADVLDCVITADKRLAPTDEHDYRGALIAGFASYGIVAPAHRIVDEDGTAAPVPRGRGRSPGPDLRLAQVPRDPDTVTHLGLRYEHLNLAALRTSPEEVYQFIWNNPRVLGIDVRLTTRVERVLASTRSGPDGLIVTEVVADYVQSWRTTLQDLPSEIARPVGMPADAKVVLWGGGVLVFDQFGRFRLHQRQPLLDADRQSRRLAHLFRAGITDADGVYGSDDGRDDHDAFALLHDEAQDGGVTPGAGGR